MNMPVAQKLELATSVLERYTDLFRVVPMHEHARSVSSNSKVLTQHA
jgi:hypothetical protein